MLFQNKNKRQAPLAAITEAPLAQWLDAGEAETEGQLAIDVYQTAKKIVIKSTIAGVKPENLKISLHHDLLTVKGTREADRSIKEEDYLYRECYWGSFSRSVILPAEVDGKRVEAELANGVLTVTLYKTETPRIEVKAKD
jgi:HSP20 family protein